VHNLSLDDSVERKNVQDWAQMKINSYNEELMEIDVNQFSPNDVEVKSERHEDLNKNLIEDEQSEIYDQRMISADKQFGRSTINAGSHKVVKVDENEFYKTTQEKISSNWFQNDSSSSKVKDENVQHEISETFSEKHLNHVTQAEANLEKYKEEEYEDDFEDYNSKEENKTEKHNEIKKLDRTTQFSLLNLNYEKIRNDLSDYSLLLLKTTATSEGVNRKGILEKKTCALLHTLKRIVSDPELIKNKKEFYTTNDIFSYLHTSIDTNSKVFELFPNSLIRLLYISVKSESEEKPESYSNQIFNFSLLCFKINTNIRFIKFKCWQKIRTLP
jgi:hypothetical protein